MSDGGHAFDSRGALHDHASSSRAGQHFIVSKSPFMCHCGQHFTRLGSLERHVRNKTKQLDRDLHPCTECTAHRGKNGFKRKDHLIQHLRVFHKWDDDQLATLSPAGQNFRLKISVCHFPECDYYRGPDFKDMGIREQAMNRPFDKQSHYTDHMKREHDWSPYPCKFAGCSKVNGTGFFSTTTLERHYREKHPGRAIPVPNIQGCITKTVRCDYCRETFNRTHIRYHQAWRCEGELACRYCRERLRSREQWVHLRYCKGEVVCQYCHERVEKRGIRDHQLKDCRGEFVCRFCDAHMEARHVKQHSQDCFKGDGICFRCSRATYWGTECFNCEMRFEP
ncbi:hypothetical protein F4680DRAFT_415172 [Xylaria scruposa]|nr:hypothetical protein F4680DRAFT_415172 [Xylaria scruposa]